MKSTSLMRREPDRCACGVDIESRDGQAYNEEAFRYFLALERKLAKRSSRGFLLVLVSEKKQPGTSGHLDREVAAKLFSELWLCLRDTDLVGWFREGRIVGALLTELGGAAGRSTRQLMRTKVRAALREGLPPDVVSRLQIRVHLLSSRPMGRSDRS